MRTDTERLDWLQKQTVGYGEGWIARMSIYGRGYRLHETSMLGGVSDVRNAIDAAMDSQPRESPDATD